MSKKDIDRRRELRAERRLEGLCTECGVLSEVGRTKCLKCLQDHNKISTKRHIKNIKVGRCSCGKEKDSQSEYRCSSCREYHRVESQKLRQKRKDNGLCMRCGKPLVERTDVSKCINCMEEGNFKW